MRKFEKIGVVLVGYTEIIIGIVTLISLVEANLMFGITKPLAVLLFVALAAMASFVLGIGILKYKMWARNLLIFFSWYIALTKIFIFLGLITLSPALEIFIPGAVKNFISLIYHILIVIFLSAKKIRSNFK